MRDPAAAEEPDVDVEEVDGDEYDTNGGDIQYRSIENVRTNE